MAMLIEGKIQENLEKQKEIRDKIFEHKDAIKSLRSDLYDLLLELQNLKNQQNKT